MTNTNTTTATATNTSTNTNTTTNTVTSTLVVDASAGDGNYTFNQDGTGQLVTDYSQTINQDFVQQFDQDIVQDIVQEIPIFYPGGISYAEADAFYGLNEEGNISQDDYTTDLGANRTIIEVLGDGYVMIQKDFVQNFDQDIVQDVYYEIDLIQDIVQEVGINQTYTVDVLKTETRTRLVGE